MAKSIRPAEYDHGRYAAGLFAATVVMTVGLGTCLILVSLLAPNLVEAVLVFIAGIAGLAWLLWAVAEKSVRPSADCEVWIAQREALKEHVESFRPEARRHRGRDYQGTGNRPPSVDDIRQIRQNSNAWVPSEARAQEYRRALGQ